MMLARHLSMAFLAVTISLIVRSGGTGQQSVCKRFFRVISILLSLLKCLLLHGQHALFAAQVAKGSVGV